jgi:acyl dehydratase
MPMTAKLSYEALKEGEELFPLVKGEINKQMLVEYGEAALDGNPMHTDDEFAQDAGYPGVFAQGMLSMGFLGQFLVERFGIESLERFKVRFSRITWPGETITCRATVARKRLEGGRKFADLDIHTENQEGEKKLVGTATVCLK